MILIMNAYLKKQKIQTILMIKFLKMKFLNLYNIFKTKINVNYKNRIIYN